MMRKNYVTLTIVLAMLVNLIGTSMAPELPVTVLASEFKDAPAVADPPRIPPAWFLSTTDSPQPAGALLEGQPVVSDARATVAQSADPETYTDDTGHYRFAGLPHGTHKVTLDPGTLPSHLRPAPSPLSLPLGGMKGGEETVDVLWLTPGMEQVSEPLFTGVRFTAVYDRASGDISGVVFLDLDGDGQPGPDEPGLPGVRVVDPTVHQYFVPFDDRDLWTLFEEKDQCHNPLSDPPDPPLISSVFLTSGSDGTVYYYDHWEDGYDDDPLNPDPSGSTKVGVLDAGATQLFASNIDIALWGTAPYYHDGGDRITIFGEDGTVVRLAHPSDLLPEHNPGVKLAAAWEMPEAADWGTEYVATVGEDLDFNGAPEDDHDYAGLEVMAWQDGTDVYYNGVWAKTLDVGEVFFVERGVFSADRITATAPIQVQMMTGGCGAAFSAHGYTLQPVHVWDDAYWASVPGFADDCNSNEALTADTDIYLHNPNSSPITVTATSDLGTVDVSIPANTTGNVLGATLWSDISTGFQGVHLSSSAPFWGVGVIDSFTAGGAVANSNYDWGYVLIPEANLSSQVVVGYAPGNPGGMSDNGNVAFVTAVTNTTIYVDLNQDGLPDPFDMDSDGRIVTGAAWGVAGWNEPLSALGVPLEMGQVLRVGDPNDRDLMGARIYTPDMQERIAAAWGQDPCQARIATYTDLGYTIFPIPTPRLSKVDELADDADLTGDISPGDTITYTIVLHNNNPLGSLNTVELVDNLPYTHTDFVVGSLQISTPPPTRTVTYDSGAGFVATPTSNTQKIRITWDTLGPDKIVTMIFRVTLHNNIPLSVTEISNQGWVNAENIAEPVWSEDPDDPKDPDTDTPVSRPLLAIDKSVSPTPIRPGDRVTYTLVVTNNGGGLAMNLSITDALPLEMRYVTGTLDFAWPTALPEIVTRIVSKTARFTDYYADDFDLTITETTYYTGNDGPLNWTSDWTELLDGGDPSGGQVYVTTTPGDALTEPACLEITDTGDDDAGVWRTADLSAFHIPLLRYYPLGFTDNADDQYSVQANGDILTTTRYNGLYTLGEINLASYITNPVSLTFLASNSMEPADYYRFDNVAIYESDPDRFETTILTWTQRVLSYTFSTGGDPVSYDPTTGSMVITQGMRLPAGGVITISYQAQATIPLTDGLRLTNMVYLTSTNWADITKPPTDTAPIEIVSAHEITLTKSAWPDPAQAGALLTYTLRYTVTGDGVAPDAIISDATPTSTTFQSCSGGIFCGGPPVGGNGVVTWSLGSIPKASSGLTMTTDAVTMVVRVASPLISGTKIHNLTTISDGGGITATSEITTLVESSHTLDIGKAVQPSPVAPGGYMTYTIVYTLTGNEPAYDVTVFDTTPESTTFYTATPPADVAPATGFTGTVVWRLGDFLTYTVQTTGAVTMVVQADPVLANGSVISNVAFISDTVTIITATGELTTTVLSWHSLAITKTAQPSPVQAGELLTYTIDWAVAGNETAPDVTISDPVPVSTTFRSCGPAASCAEAGGVVAWTLGDRTSGESGTVTFTVLVAYPLISGTLLYNSATISDSDSISGTGVLTTPVESAHTLMVNKEVTPIPVSPGGWITYTIAYTVTGNEPAPDVTISDTTPDYTTFYTSIPPADSDPGVGGSGPVIWRLGDFLTAASSITQATGLVTLIVQADTPLTNGLTIRNVVLISDTILITDTDEVTTTVESWHSLAITKTAQPSPVQAGDLLTYTIDWAVAGNEPVLDVTISDAVPVSTTFQSCGPLPCAESGGVVAWTLGDRIPGESGAVTLTVLVASPLISGALLSNSATISDSTGWITDTPTITTPVDSAHTLMVNKEVTPIPVSPGGRITYTIAYTVTGNEPAPDVTISDMTPEYTTFYTSIPPADSDPGVGGSGPVIWRLGDLLTAASGITQATGLVTLIVQADTPLTNGLTIRNVVLISDTILITDTDEVTTTVESWHSLAITKTAQPSPVQAGDLLTYTIDWAVAGNEPVPDVTISDAAPVSTTFQSCSPLPCAEAGGVVAWTLGDRTPGESGAVTLTVIVASPLISGTLLYNSAIISDSTGLITNTPTITTPVGSWHSLAITKTAQPSPVQAGDLLTYTLFWAVAGNEPARDVTVSDATPVNTTFYTATQPTASAPLVGGSGLVVWSLGDQTAPSSGAMTLVVQVNSDVPTGTILLNSAAITDTDGVTGTDEITTSVEVRAAVVVDKRLTGTDDDLLMAPNYITFTIVITNAGDNALDTLPLSDQYDLSDLSFVGSTPSPQEGADDGILTWYDLTGPAPYGFDRNLAPGESFLITTVFSMVHDTITVTTVNTAIVSGARDVYGNPAEDADDDEIVTNVPTAIELLYFRAGDVGGRQVRLEWATAVEIDNFGFNLYRAVGQAFQPIKVDFVPSLAHGGGATYVYIDTTPTAGPSWYWLADVDTSGRETFHGPVSTVVEATTQLHRIYLPLVAKGAGSKETKSPGKKTPSASSRNIPTGYAIR